jgi:aminoglycoside phosphotransferase family enzyme
MTRDQVDRLLAFGEFADSTRRRELVETHISWVILCDRFVYKIKKPVRHSFLDFSTPELRKYYCEREIQLNLRLTEHIYIDVQPVCVKGEKFLLGRNEGVLIDHAVRMHKQDRERQMDRLLLTNRISGQDIKNLAKKIAVFHRNAEIIRDKDFLQIGQDFNDLSTQQEFVFENLGVQPGEMITEATAISEAFIQRHKGLLAQRLSKGYFRDVHGDLHSRNIFLLPDPQPFDCIEFNDNLRQIDVLNEVAFLCMDLDAMGRKPLSELFINYYNHFFPTITTAAERELFMYYKGYRANVRAKVNSLRAGSAVKDTEKSQALAAAEKYLFLMDGYLQSLSVAHRKV